MATYGYRYGPQQIEFWPVDSSSTAIVAGDPVSFATAGYIKKAAAGDVIRGIAIDALATAELPGSDGAVKIRVDVATTSVYEYPPDSGSVTEALRGTYLDFGGSQTIDIDATTDKTFYVVGVNTITNTVHVSMVRTAA